MILLLVIGQIVLMAGLLALPRVVQAIPGRYRVALAQRSPFLSEIAEGVIELVAPVATALPAPTRLAGEPQIDIATLIAVVPTATPEATAAPPTPEPTVEATLAPTDTPTITPTPEPTATPTAEPLPARLVLEGLQPIAQSFNNCGPANLTQVLTFHGYNVDQAAVANYLKPNTEDRNVSPWQIVDYVTEQTGGTLSASFHSGGTLDLVKRLIAAGFPVVLEKGYEPNTANAPGWWGHYLTVFGYDDTLQEIYGLDTFLGPFDSNEGRPTSYAEIERYWQQFNYTFYVVYRPDQAETVQAILGPDMLDTLAMWRNAAARAELETRSDPSDAFAWFNLGESLTRLGENSVAGNNDFYQAGAQAFDQARSLNLPPRMLWYQFRPYIAYLKVGRYQDVIDLADATLATQGGRNVEETYWYRGQALEFLGDIAGAREAYETALQVNSNFYPAQISLDWVNSLGG
jgi:hypothetical protein